MFDRLGQVTVFSKMYLKAVFHQMRVRKEYVDKTAFKTKYGHFEFMVIPMGLYDAPVTFQSLMNAIFSNCIDKFLVVYLYGILIYINAVKEHLEHLELTLERLQVNKLYAGKSKCEIFTSHTECHTECLGLFIGK